MWMDNIEIGENIVSDWRSLPALRFNNDVVYMEIDVANTWLKAIREPTGPWQTSYY
jgi:hypothetical protein